MKKTVAATTKKVDQSKKLLSVRHKSKRFDKIRKDRDISATTQRKNNKKKIVRAAKSKQTHLIVRVMDLGQFSLSKKNAKKINQLDNSLVDIVKSYDLLKKEFRKTLTKTLSLVVKEGKSLDDKQIVKSDIILPPGDISIDEAGKLFIGAGTLPESILH